MSVNKDTRESLALELAEERMAETIESCMQGGVKYDDVKIEDFMNEAFEFVDRCMKIALDNLGR